MEETPNDYCIKEIRHGAVKTSVNRRPHDVSLPVKAGLFLSDMMPSIPTHFIIAKSEASFVNTQVITDKIQEQIKMGRDCVGIRSQASAAANAQRRHSELI